MNYSINYSVISIYHYPRTRTTVVTIVNEATGEVFNGSATRNPADKMDIALATNLATERAIRKAVITDLKDCEDQIINFGTAPQFNN